MTPDELPPVGDLPSSDPHPAPLWLLFALAVAVSVALALVSR